MWGEPAQLCTDGVQGYANRQNVLSHTYNVVFYIGRSKPVGFLGNQLSSLLCQLLWLLFRQYLFAAPRLCLRAVVTEYSGD